MKKFRISLLFFISVSTLSSCWSSTGDIEYVPSDEAPAARDPRFSIAILDFNDDRFSIKKYRSKRKSSLVGVFFGGYRNPIRKVYSNQPISLEVIDAFENLFIAVGISVKRYAGHSTFSGRLPERLAVKGRINEFFLKSYPGLRSKSLSLEARIDIDLDIFDQKYQKLIWSGKVVDVREMPSHKGVFTGTKQIFLFLNEVFSEAIRQAWTNRGMAEALGDVVNG